MSGRGGAISPPSSGTPSTIDTARRPPGARQRASAASAARARGLPEGKERTEQYQTINAQIAATVPAVPIAFPISALALSDRVLKYPASPVLNEVFTKVELKP